MGRKRQGPSPSVPERNRQFARHLDRLLSEASLDPSELAALLGRTEVLIYGPSHFSVGKFGVQKGIKEGPFHARYRCLLETVESATALEGGSDLSRSPTTPSRRLARPSPQRLIPLSRVWHPFPAL